MEKITTSKDCIGGHTNPPTAFYTYKPEANKSCYLKWVATLDYPHAPIKFKRIPHTILDSIYGNGVSMYGVTVGE
jgi:hypothetical protein